MAAKKRTVKKIAKTFAKKFSAKKTTTKHVVKKKKVVAKPRKIVHKKKIKIQKRKIKKEVKKIMAKKTVKKKLALKKPASKKAAKKVIRIKKTPTQKKAVKLAPKKALKKSIFHVTAGTLFVGNLPPYQPGKREAYMSEKMQNHFRKILMAWKQELMEKADFTMTHMKDDAANYADPNDRASQEEGFSLELRARDRERKLIRKIEETLDIIDVAEYGYCKECGEEIGLRRLEARPTASLCVDCKTLDEIKEKQTGV